MKKQGLVLGMLAMALTFGLVVAGCGEPDDGDDGGGGGGGPVNALTWTALTAEQTKFDHYLDGGTALGGTTINAIAYGGGKFVAVGVQAAAYSTDGVSWTAVDDAVVTSMFGSSHIEGIA
ncbi:MAG: hypothetical protein LBB47_06275, partial [Spirochaetaceae bacterium]|nr:hypothetical protein [Spirochaetaceae bacterium]